MNTKTKPVAHLKVNDVVVSTVVGRGVVEWPVGKISDSDKVPEHKEIRYAYDEKVPNPAGGSTIVTRLTDPIVLPNNQQVEYKVGD